MVRDSSDYAEHEVQPESDDYTDDDFTEIVEAEDYGMLDKMTDLVLGEAEVVAEVEDDDDEEYELRKKLTSAKKKVTSTAKRTAGAVKTSAKVSGAVAKTAVKYSPTAGFMKLAVQKNPKATVSSGSLAGKTAGIKRVLVKFVIVGVILGLVIMALRATPLGPVVDKLNAVGKKTVGKVIKAPGYSTRRW